MGRLYETTGASGTTRFLQDGDELVADFNSSGTLLRRYVHGSSVDDPVVWYEGSAIGPARWLHTDWQGSIIGVTDSSGASIAINRYDEYGIPGSANTGRFQYTGQAWIPELGMYYYKARIYSPTLGRFMQTDPIGYKDQTNLYAYVGNDPVNKVDPNGLCETGSRVGGKGSGCKYAQEGGGAPERAIRPKENGNTQRSAPMSDSEEAERLGTGSTVVGSVSSARSILNPAVDKLGKVPLATAAKVAVKSPTMAGEFASAYLTYKSLKADGKNSINAAINTGGRILTNAAAGAASGTAASFWTANPYLIGAATVFGAVGVDLIGVSEKVGNGLERMAMGAAIVATGRVPY